MRRIIVPCVKWREQAIGLHFYFALKYLIRAPTNYAGLGCRARRVASSVFMSDSFGSF